MRKHSSFSLRLQHSPRKRPSVPVHEKLATVKTEGNPAIFAALDYFANFATQLDLGFRGETCGNDPDPIADLQKLVSRICVSFPLRLQPELYPTDGCSRSSLPPDRVLPGNGEVRDVFAYLD